MEIRPYLRKVHYYETDQMTIVHHSNYIRWFEEARIDFMDQIGCSYRQWEESGLLIPVVDVSCKYVQSVRFDDTVDIHVRLHSFTGVRLSFSYEIYFHNTDILAAAGSSTHCFLNADRKPVSIKRLRPEYHQLLQNCLTAE